MPLPPGVIAADTITKLPPEADGAVILSGSHGGVYPGYLAAKAKVRAVIFNDAGVGRDEAGVGSLAYLEALGIAAATVSNLSCRIGDTADMVARGVISRVNGFAVDVDVTAGMSCAEAAGLLRMTRPRHKEPPPIGEGRTEAATGGNRRIILIDSAAMVKPEDAGQIIVTGSHGGLVGGNPAMALRTEGFAAVFHDAGIGIDDAGITRLSALDRRGIAAFTVAGGSARIGDAKSIFQDGEISAVNETAQKLDAHVGYRACEVLERWASL
ncbi:hypothetical protein GJW-30_1_00623 [Variibacter gotjawalensis]|uniref:Uncharacterized protein n=1 Tax=Variibacter gotjawalensis TaxID=1333996 RepID=A0A0S3PQG3_9BRAD|nr:hypothetical protein [Variibacter gotjawalensis]NIK48408.1 hypothetical protein [Variibacter gotjawalensis]RZS50275.1 hypothetical protein EV661_2731 [Variibacter gotjawalensis]BAT58108.1 hypothetical protein GJW-30_1_00623 [Variibacter gotjawalensis]